jgi:hypothetical protein
MSSSSVLDDFERDPSSLEFKLSPELELELVWDAESLLLPVRSSTFFADSILGL